MTPHISVCTHDSALMIVAKLARCVNVQNPRRQSTGLAIRQYHAASRADDNSLLYAPSMMGKVGCRPRSHKARCAHPKPLKTTAFTPWPGKVESPTQYNPFTAAGKELGSLNHNTIMWGPMSPSISKGKHELLRQLHIS